MANATELTGSFTGAATSGVVRLPTKFSLNLNGDGNAFSITLQRKHVDGATWTGVATYTEASGTGYTVISNTIAVEGASGGDFEWRLNCASATAVSYCLAGRK